MKLRTEIPKKVKVSKSERKMIVKFCDVKSFWWLLGLFLGDKKREANGEIEKRCKNGDGVSVMNEFLMFLALAMKAC